MNLLGGVFCGQQRYSEAEPLLVQGYEEMKKRETLMNANWHTGCPKPANGSFAFTKRPTSRTRPACGAKSSKRNKRPPRPNRA